MDKAVEIKGLTKLYKSGRGIKEIDVTINKGEIIGLLGPNGAGKTTLLKCMTGLIKPDSGSVQLFGKDLQNSYKEAIRSVGACIGPAVAYENMTPLQNLQMISRLNDGITRNEMDQILLQTGLTPYKNEKIVTFSMGMKQRFGIAAALLTKPQLVILDEPTNGLDIAGLLEFRKIIQTISEEKGVTFVLSSHHLSELEKLCHRYCFLIQGEASFYDESGLSLEEVYVRKVEESVDENHLC